jgi:hypothetical protein
MKAQKFVHKSLGWPFKYDNTFHSDPKQNLCPITAPCKSGSPDCPDYVNYSPFGEWNINVASGNSSAATAVRFLFHVSFYNSTDITNDANSWSEVSTVCVFF